MSVLMKQKVYFSIFLIGLFLTIFSISLKSDCIYVPIAINNLYLYEKADLKSNIIYKIDCLQGNFVQIIKTTNKSDKKNGLVGKWVMVEYMNYTGWVLDCYLAYNYKFEKVSGWCSFEKNVCSGGGDSCEKYLFFTNGEFKKITKPCEFVQCSKEEKQRMCLKNEGEWSKDQTCHFNGQVYRYLNCFYMRNKNQNKGDYFYLIKKQLCQPQGSCFNLKCDIK